MSQYTRSSGRSEVLRFEDKYIIDDDTGCFQWVASVGRTGYGQFKSCVGGLAHRYSYELYVGKIPEGLDLDHLCRNRACVNPEHLEPVTRRENLARGINHCRSKTHCKRGHEFTAENTYIRDNRKRRCRACRRKSYDE